MKSLGPRYLKRLIREDIGLAYTAVGTLTSNVISALFWLVLASILTIENYGMVNYYIAIASTIAAVGLLGLNTTVTTYVAKGEKALLYEANSITLIIATIFTIIVIPFQWTTAFLLAGTVFFQMTLAQTLGQKNYRRYSVITVGQRLTQIALSLLLYFQLGPLGLLTGYFLSYFVFSYPYLKTALKFTLRIDQLKPKRNFTLHNFGVGLITTSSIFLDKIMIAALFGYYTLGIYQLGFQFFIFLNLIPLSLQQYLLPEESSGKDKKKIKMIGIFLSVACSIAASVSIPYLIQNLFPTFIDATHIVVIMSLAVIPSTIVAVMSASLLGKGKSKIVFIAALIYLASLTTGLVVLGQTMGAIGLAITLVVAQTIQATCLIASQMKSRPTLQKTQKRIVS